MITTKCIILRIVMVIICVIDVANFTTDKVITRWSVERILNAKAVVLCVSVQRLRRLPCISLTVAADSRVNQRIRHAGLARCDRIGIVKIWSVGG